MSGRRRNPVRTLFKVETLTPDSVIIVRAGSAFDTKQNLESLFRELGRRNLGKVMVLRLEKLEDFHVLSEEQMNKVGWFRKEKEVIDGPKPE